jgi:hypothetical protein
MIPGDARFAESPLATTDAPPIRDGCGAAMPLVNLFTDRRSVDPGSCQSRFGMTLLWCPPADGR